MKKWINYTPLVISAFFLVVGIKYQGFAFASASIALLVAFREIMKSSKIEKKINEYDNAFQTHYDRNGTITSMTIDSGDY